MKRKIVRPRKTGVPVSKVLNVLNTFILSLINNPDFSWILESTSIKVENGNTISISNGTEDLIEHEELIMELNSYLQKHCGENFFIDNGPPPFVVSDEPLYNDVIDDGPTILITYKRLRR